MNSKHFRLYRIELELSAALMLVDRTLGQLKLVKGDLECDRSTTESAFERSLWTLIACQNCHLKIVVPVGHARNDVIPRHWSDKHEQSVAKQE
jgi:hypothetical protein